MIPSPLARVRRVRRVRRVLCAFLPVSSFPALLLAPAAFAQPAPEQIVITANRTPQPLSAVLADVSIIDRAGIERAAVGSVVDLLARLPGIEFVRNGGPGASTSVYIRGGENRHTAVYIDGVRFDSQASGGPQWEQLPLEQIERIEVVRGPAAAVYGSDAIAGVVQIFTRQGQGPARPTAALTLGSYGTVQGQVGLSGASQGWNYAFSAAQARSSGFDATRPGGFAHNPDKDGWRRSSLQARVGYRVDERHSLDASLLASHMKSGYDGSPTTDDQNENTVRNGHLAWAARWSADANTRLQIGQTETRYETQPSFYRTETTLRDYTLLHEQRMGPGRVTGTLERREDELFNPATPFGAAFGGRRHQNALGLGWRGDFAGHALQLRARRDDDSEFGTRNTGSLSWGWTFVPQWRLSATVATSFRVPTLYQRFSEYGNPDLVPESGRNAELGLRYAAAGSELSLTAWRNRMTQLISFGAAGPCASTFGCYVNVGRAELKGLSLAGRTTLAGVELHGSLDWHDPRNLASGKTLPRRARRLASFGVQTRMAGWQLGSEVQAAAQRFDNAANTQRLGGYALVNLTASRALRPGLVLEARLDNLGDKKYELARSYVTPGRSGQLTLRWTL